MATTNQASCLTKAMEEHTYLMEMFETMSDSSFVASLREFYEVRHFLTPKQKQALTRMMEERLENTAE